MTYFNLIIKSVIMKKLLFLVIISSAFLFLSCNKDGEGSHTVKYNISSGSTMNVSYTDADGTLKSVNNVSSSWTYSFNTPGNGRVFSLIINSTNGSSVGGSIYVDGQEAIQDNSNNSSITLTTQVP